MCRILKGCLLQHEGVISLCCCFSCNGLVIFCFVLSFMIFVVFIFWLHVLSLLDFFCMLIIILLNGGRLRVLFCFLGFYLIQNWRLQCFRHGMLLFHIYYMRFTINASNFSLHAALQLLICTTTYHMDLRQQQGLLVSNELGAGNAQAAK